MRAVSFPYMRGSYCSIIYRWCTVFQKFNRTQIAMQVPDDLVVICMLFEDFLPQLDAILLCEKGRGKKQKESLRR